jgi:putative ABC transport system permease protein
VAARMQQQYPDDYRNVTAFRAAASPLLSELTSEARPTLLILLGTAGLVLLTACANVANLMLARLIRRDRELAIRSTLGAGRQRILRQLLTESTLLAAAGGLLGLLLAAGGLQLLLTFARPFLLRADDIRMDGTVLAFTVAVSVVTGLAFGSLPALSARPELGQVLKEDGGRTTAGGRRQRARRLLIVSQLALSFVLLVGAGLMVRSLIKLQQVAPGFDPENVLTMTVSLNWTKYDTPERRAQFWQPLLERLRDQPGVRAAGVAAAVPLNQDARFNGTFQVEDRPVAPGQPAPTADADVVSADYFKSIGTPLLKGRFFAATDAQDTTPVALVNAALARRTWGNDDPVGRRLSLNSGQTWLTVVGVVGDVRQFRLDRPAGECVYLPLLQNPLLEGSLFVRTAGDPMAMAREVKAALRVIDPQQPVANVRTLEQVRSASLAPQTLTAVLLGLFAALALVITTTGVAGLVAYTVSQRTHEIGIRMALGARRASVLAMVMRQGLALVVLGLLFGMTVALGLSRLLSRQLFDVRPTDPATFLAVSLVFLAAAAVACLVPARRATAIDPLLALRSE